MTPNENHDTLAVMSEEYDDKAMQLARELFPKLQDTDEEIEQTLQELEVDMLDDEFPDDRPSILESLSRPTQTKKKGFPHIEELHQPTFSTEQKDIKVASPEVLKSICQVGGQEIESCGVEAAVKLSLYSRREKIVEKGFSLSLRGLFFTDFLVFKEIFERYQLVSTYETIKGTTKYLTFSNETCWLAMHFSYPLAKRLTESKENSFNTDVNVALTGNEESLKVLEEVKQKLIEIGFKGDDDELEENVVEIEHYFFGHNGKIQRKDIETFYHSFDTIKQNYNADVIAKTEKTMDEILSEEELSGKLLLYHGSAGTGKTTLIQSMLGELEERTSAYTFVVISSPHVFLTDPSYYYSIISHSSRVIFILEDVGDLFAMDNKSMRMEEMSNFLNLTDGILGKSRRDVFICTFNYDVNKMDDAIVRPGRCLANINVPPLDYDGTVEMLKNYGITDNIEALLENKEYSRANVGMVKDTKKYVLSNLFEIIRERKQQ